MKQNKKYFLDFLSGFGHVNVIFEPYISRAHSETILWRRSNKLWSTPAEYINTLATITERIESDFFFADMRFFTSVDKKELLSAISDFKEKDEFVGVGIICDSQADVDAAAKIADCLCIYGDAVCDSLHVVRMDGSIEDAIRRGDSGWYATRDAPHYLEAYGNKIKILGGLGVDFLKNSTPLKINSTVAALLKKYSGKWACGSGGTMPNDNYLEFASMLTAFSKNR